MEESYSIFAAIENCHVTLKQLSKRNPQNDIDCTPISTMTCGLLLRRLLHLKNPTFETSYVCSGLHFFFLFVMRISVQLALKKFDKFFFVKYKASPSAAIDVNSMLSFLANSLREIKHVTCFQVWLVFFLLTLTLHSYSKYDCLLNLLTLENVMQCFGLDIALQNADRQEKKVSQALQ